MRPRSKLTQKIHQWVALSEGWFSHWKIDSALNIKNQKDKTLRRVTLKRLCDKGALIRDPQHDGVYKKVTPLKEIDWNQKS